jgi:hypothetical protein
VVCTLDAERRQDIKRPDDPSLRLAQIRVRYSIWSLEKSFS